MKRLAVIDLGTNTFHLLIVEVEKAGPFKEIFRKSTFVQLAEEGIEHIGVAPFQRGLATLQAYQKIIADHQVDGLKAFGTAALRTANNGSDFAARVKAVTGIEVQLIPGSEEARLIHRGVIQAVPFGEEKNMIIDIGGGSVEFIIADKETVYWCQSFPIGVAILYREWHHQDPIDAENIQQIKHFLLQQLQPLFAALTQYPSVNLIGASGAFDVLEFFLCKDHQTNGTPIIPIAHFYPFYHSLLQMSLSERFQMPGLPREKAEMIIVALILIDLVIEKANIENIYVSGYAMKEGILREMLEG